MLCSVEDLFGLKHLGYAAQPGLPCFGKDVYNKASGYAPGRVSSPRRQRPGVNTTARG